MRHILAAAAAMLLPAPLAAQSIAITDATVIDPASAAVRPHTTVLVRDGRITAVQPVRMPVPADARRLDGRGKYLIPGLWDAHTHLSKSGRSALALYLANGVTGVRDMGSNLNEVAGWRAAVASGRMAGPRIKLAGPMLEARSNIDRMLRENTVENVARQRIGIANPTEGREAVRALARTGVDHIKVRTVVDLPTFAAISDEAAKHHLPLAAHVNGTPDEMIAAGLDSAEHWLDFPPLDYLGPGRRRALFGRVARTGMRVSNTLVVFRNVMTPYTQGRRILAAANADPDRRRRYVCGYLVKDWAEQLEEAREAKFGPIRQVQPGLNRDFHEMHAVGVPLLAGSDAGVLFTYAGFSLHDQLELMVKNTGLTPMEVLQIATTGVPTYFGEADRVGAIRLGRAADLVLLEADPLRQIGNTRKVSAVVAQGRLYDRPAIRRMLDEVEADARGPCALGSKAGDR